MENLEYEPPIQLKTPELEMAWRGLVYSIQGGYITREEAIDTLRSWDNGQESGIIYCRQGDKD